MREASTNTSSRRRLGHRLVEIEQILIFQTELIKWWNHNQRSFPWRRPKASKFQLIIAEILLQRTRAETVGIFWPTFTARFPSWAAIGAAGVSELEKALAPIGLSKQRAPRLHALAVIMSKRNGRFSKDRESVESLPGVGQYIANAILLFCHGKPHPLIDVNMARVLERVFGTRKLADIRYDPYLQALATEIVQTRRGKELNWAVLDFAALVCTSRNPHCFTCPIARICRFADSVIPSV